MIKRLVLCLTAVSLTACTGLFDKDNTPTPTPLVPFTSEVKTHLLWSSKTSSGGGKEYLKLNPALYGNSIYTAGAGGVVTSTNKQNGQTNWSVSTGLAITSGPGVGAGLVVVGTRDGAVLALDQFTGAIRWKTSIDGEALASPAVGNQAVFVKAIDGSIHALALNDGHQLWVYEHTEPNLILRGSSSPLLRDGSLFVGFANGNLAKMSTHNGQVFWMQPIAIPQGAFSIQRMIDIDADPVIDGHRVYAATYQGNIASLSWGSGETLWSHDISSYTGMAADPSHVFITDAKGDVWSFGANSGSVNWRQTQLTARNVSPPALLGNYVVVGDEEGYLHWLSKQDGHFVARDFVGNTIIAKPIVDNGVVYVLTNNGSLAAYTLG